eukprot:TRINITY_DN4785_c0_g1_i1.p1 TRINITY_DN4785_c0_g1~~TRINITY_DN4785_c0_g1_i1.p1  ORF type:complete len:124 (+),score=9.24 TRINITY_DN4785_c0_g1_i1:98-469(+)
MSLQTVTAVAYGFCGALVVGWPTFFNRLVAQNGNHVNGVSNAILVGLGLQAITVAWLYGSIVLTPKICRGFAALMIPFFMWDIYFMYVNPVLSKLIWFDFIANIFWAGSALYTSRRLKQNKPI